MTPAKLFPITFLSLRNIYRRPPFPLHRPNPKLAAKKVPNRHKKPLIPWLRCGVLHLCSTSRFHNAVRHSCGATRKISGYSVINARTIPEKNTNLRLILKLSIESNPFPKKTVGLQFGLQYQVDFESGSKLIIQINDLDVFWSSVPIYLTTRLNLGVTGHRLTLCGKAAVLKRLGPETSPFDFWPWPKASNSKGWGHVRSELLTFNSRRNNDFQQADSEMLGAVHSEWVTFATFLLLRPTELSIGEWVLHWLTTLRPVEFSCAYLECRFFRALLFSSVIPKPLIGLNQNLCVTISNGNKHRKKSFEIPSFECSFAVH